MDVIHSLAELMGEADEEVGSGCPGWCILNGGVPLHPELPS